VQSATYPKSAWPREGGRTPFGDTSLDRASERTIAVSRIVLATGGLLAAYLDPDQPSQGAIGYAFLGAYVLYSLALLATVSRPLKETSCIAGHIAETGLICTIIISTEGPSSPFFVYFTFVLLTATLRWQWRGALFTGALLSLVLIALSITQLLADHGSADIDRLILRNLYLLVASALFAVLGEHLVRSQERQGRLRLAHELHDGILQTLTAARMKLYAAASAATGPEAANLLETTQLLDEEQRHIRTFVEASRNPLSSEKLSGALEIKELRAFVRHLERLWGCAIDLEIGEDETDIASVLGTAIKLMLGEAVANAVIHGDATSIAVRIEKATSTIVLKVTDNGTGLKSAEGTYNHAQLAAGNIGPRSLLDRAIALGGSLCLRTSAKGIELQFTLPEIPVIRTQR
jgi:glucose-6-phosphate-specific signal transduction histidine kinase